MQDLVFLVLAVFGLPALISGLGYALSAYDRKVRADNLWYQGD